MVGYSLEKRREMLLLLVHARVEQGVIPLPPSPQHIVGAAEEVCRLQRVFDLPGRMHKHAEVRVGSSAVFVPG